MPWLTGLVLSGLFLDVMRRGSGVKVLELSDVITNTPTRFVKCSANVGLKGGFDSRVWARECVMWARVCVCVRGGGGGGTCVCVCVHAPASARG